MPEENDFRAYRKLIIKQLETDQSNIDSLRREQQDIKIEIAVLKTKVALYAAGISFIISIAVGIAASYLSK